MYNMARSHFIGVGASCRCGIGSALRLERRRGAGPLCDEFGDFKMKIEIKKIGNSDGLLLPKELMQRLDLKRGQELHITELAGGGFQAMPYDPDFERTMEIADEIMAKYKDTLAALAK
jgi:putative addiction module antidote